MFDACSCAYLVWLSIGAIALYLLRIYLKGGQFREAIGAKWKVVVITGANTGIGLETTRELNLRGAKVYMLCRSEQRAAEAKDHLIRSGCDGSRLIYVNCDLGSKENIRQSAKRLIELEPHIDILINNAGLARQNYEQTADGHEMDWGTNHLGPFLLTELLLPLVEKAPEGRIINTSSVGHTQTTAIDLSTIDSGDNYNAGTAYCQSKLANVMHARELTRRLRAKGNTTVTVNSLHPGVLFTEIYRDLDVHVRVIVHLCSPFFKDVKDGAQTTLYCALSTELRGVSGEYFSDCRRKDPSPLALDDEAAKQLYEYSLKAVGL